MRKLDLYWMSNDEWIYQRENGTFSLKESAPEKAKKSYQNYIEQIKSNIE